MRSARGILGALTVGLAAWLFVSIFTTPAPTAEIRRFSSSKQCQECHPLVYAEWESSWHAQSWIDPHVRTMSQSFSNTDCIDCHAPRPIFETGIGERVLPRTTRRVEGVDCISCHQLPSGEMAGGVTNRSAACRPVERRELVAPEFCAGCHDQHKTVQQWKASRYPDLGQDCLSCHMPYRGGDPSQGRVHTMMGGHDPELLQQAVALRGERREGRWWIEVENVGAGHNYPTDERSRASDLFWRPLGEQTWRHLHRFRNPYRHEIDLPNTELPAHETFGVGLPDAEGATGPVEVALFYKLSPYWSDPEAPDPENESTLVHRMTLEP